MRHISTAKASQEMRRLREKLQRLFEEEQEKQGLPENLHVWYVARTEWYCRGNRNWQVVIGYKENGQGCNSGFHKTSVTKALQQAIDKYKKEEEIKKELGL